MKQETISELERIRDEHDGVLHPQDVVEAARNEASPLHAYFVWDDSAAAHKYRVWQARQLIEVVVTVLPHNEQAIQAYVSLRSDRLNGGGYRAIIEVLNDNERRAELLQQALRELIAIKSKYAQLKALSPVFKAIDKVRIAA